MAELVWADDFTGGIMQTVEKSPSDGYLRLKPQPAIGQPGGTGGVVVVPALEAYAVQEYTVAGWYNLDYLSDYTGFFSRKAAKDSGSSDIEIYFGNGGVTLVHNRSNGGQFTYWYALNSEPAIDQWAFVAYTFSQGKWRTYRNGVLVEIYPSAAGSPLAHPGYVLVLGQGYTSGIVRGAAFGFSFWGRALSDQEIADLMYRIPKPDENGLVGCWLLNEGAGSVANDFSRYANAGTLYGAPWSNRGKWAGVRVVELNLSDVGVVQSSQTAWTATEPAGTGVTIETNLSLDGGVTWQRWAVCTNGGAIPGIAPGTNLSNARLKIWEHLHTKDPAVEPVLHSLTIAINSAASVGLPRRVIPVFRPGRIHPVPHRGRVYPSP